MHTHTYTYTKERKTYTRDKRTIDRKAQKYTQIEQKRLSETTSFLPEPKVRLHPMRDPNTYVRNASCASTNTSCRA